MAGPEIIRATIVHTPGAALSCHEDGGLLICEGRIAACDDFSRVRAAHPTAAVSDRRGSFLTPGFVDAHVHFPQLRVIGALGRSLLDWLDQVALPEEARMAAAPYARETARRFIAALASHGTTTALVFGAHFPEATAALFDAAAAGGLRILSGLVLSDRLLRPELHQSPVDAYRESAALIRRYHNRGRLRYAVTPRFAVSTSEAMLEVCQTLLSEHPDVRLQTHINENRSEIAQLTTLFPWAGDYLAVYERYALNGPRSVMAHNVHTADSQLERLAGSRTSIAHCPSSNAMLGSGCFPLRRHLAVGVHCALGTDVGAGIGFGMLKEGLHAYLMQRVAAEEITLDVGRLLYMTTLAGAEAVGLASEIGDFTVGKAADFVRITPAPESVLQATVARANAPDEALAAIFTMGGAESIREVRVAGDVVYEQKGTST